MFTDVNGDLKTTALDALRVINHLALLAARGSEGESVASAPLSGANAPLSVAAAASGAVARDEAFADLSLQAKLVSVDSTESQVEPQSATLTFAVAEDDEDDVLSLLAGDQSDLA